MRAFLGGGIGSGKSTAGRLLAALGAVVIEADRHGHDVLAPGTPETAAVLHRWPAVVTADGGIDRSALGRIVFGDPGELAALEAITHPGIRRGVLAAVGRHPDRTVVVELPVLSDIVGEPWPWVVVDASDEVRIARVLARSPHLTEEDVRAVMSRQPERGEWLAAATWVLDNGGNEHHLAEECARLWALWEQAPGH